MRRSSLRTIALAVCVLGVLAVVAPLLLGWARLVVSAGSSMEPDITAGDLIVVLRADDYAVGDVVAYRSSDLGTVLHRIVDRLPGPGGTRFVLKGDNNDFVDAEQPQSSAILGRAALTVPNGGMLLRLLPIVAIAGFAAFWALRERRRPAPHGPSQWQTSAIAGAAIAAGCGALTLIALFATGSAVRERILDYETTADVGWSADVAPSVVYPAGEIAPDGPVFLAEVDEIEITAEVSAPADATELSGSASLHAEVSNESGWVHRIDLAGPVALDGADALLVGAIDLDDLTQLVADVAERTGYRVADHDVSLIVDAEVDGTLGGKSIEQQLTHEVVLRLDDVLLGPVPATAWGGSATGHVTVKEQASASIGFGPIQLPVGLVRVLAPLAALAGLFLLARSPRSLSPYEAVEQYLSGFVIDVEASPIPIDAAAVRVDAFEDLLRVAEIEGSPILHFETDSHEWATLAMGVWYRYCLEAMRVASRPAESLAAGS